MLDRSIDIDCIEALAGADEARLRVLSGLALGEASVEDTAYLIKCRVKDHESLVKKVQKKRATDKPNYRASDATDIIGLRLLALFRKDLPTLVDRFLDFVEAGQSHQFSLFSGHSLKQACTEVIIYTTAQDGDEVDGQVIEKLRQRDFSIGGEISGEDTVPEPDVRVVRRKSQYSSIHFIVWCRDLVRKQTNRKIPMEVQIRTSLEDVWGEIDHNLRYKSGEDAADEISKIYIKNAEDGLVDLKRLLDACAGSADTIHRQISNARNPQGTIGGKSAFSINLETLVDLPVPQELRSQIQKVVPDLKEAFGASSRAIGAKDGEEVSKLAEDFVAFSRNFEAFAEKLPDSEFQSIEDRHFVHYYILMEAALSKFSAGRLYSFAATLSEDLDTSFEMKEKSEELLDDALTTYRQVSRIPGRSKDAIVAYRRACIFTLRNEHDAALDQLRLSVSQLEAANSDVEQDHFLRSRIRRELALALWKTAERIRVRGDAIGVDAFLSEQRQRYYLDALTETLPMVGATTVADYDGIDVDPESKIPDGLKATNNALEYALCYLRSGGDQAELDKRGVTLDVLQGFCAKLEADRNEVEVSPIVWLDTLRAAHHELLKDTEGAKRFARELLSKIDEKRWELENRYGKDFVMEMEQDAEKQLR